MKLYIVSVGNKFVHDGYLGLEQAKDLQKELKNKGHKKVWVIEDTHPDLTEKFSLKEGY